MLHFIVGGIDDYAVIMLDPAGHIMSWNPGAERLKGYRDQEILGQHYSKLFLPEDVAAGTPDSALALAAARGRVESEGWRLRKDGSRFRASVVLSAMRDQRGHLQGFVKLARDVTERDAARLEMVALQERFARALRNNRDGLFESGAAGDRNALWVSPRWWEILGYDRSTCPASVEWEALLEMVHPEERGGVRSALEEARPDRLCSVEHRMRTRSGGWIWVHTQCSVEADAEGRVVRWSGSMRNITPRKRAEIELTQTLERFRIAADAAGMGVWQFDVAAGTLTWDDWMYRIYGRTPAASTEPYEIWLNSLHPEDRQRAEAQVTAALRGEREFAAEFRIVRPSGEIRHINAASHSVRAADGSVIQLTGVNIDVTERRYAEKKLLETSSLLRTILDSASQMSIIATDPNLTIKVFNSGAERLLGYSSQELVGRTTPIVFHEPEELRACGRELASELGYAVEDRAVFAKPPMLSRPREWTYICKDRSRITVSLIVNAMHNDAGELIGYVCVAQDVTQRNQTEESLRAATARAEQANIAKSEFLANMSHEIRTPLNAIIGLGYLLEQTILSEDQRQFLNKIQFAGRSLLSVVNNVLDLSKIEAGELALEQEPFNLPGLLGDISQMLAPQAAAKSIELHTRFSESLPRNVSGDAVRLRQILINLVSNAIKFTAKGQVEISALCTEQGTTRARVRCEVKDTGIGIQPETIARLFLPFTQADASTTRKFGGTGLGLSIARRFVELMGGEIGVSSHPGEGSTFWFEIPLTLAGELEDTLGGNGTRRLRIMIADPTGLGPAGLGAAVRALGWNPQFTDTGQQLLDMLADTPAGIWPDVLILQRHLPDMDAPQLVARLRRECTRCELPPVITLVDVAHSELEEELAAQASDLVLATPVTGSALFNAVNAVLSRRGGGHARVLQSTHFGDASAQWLPGVRVLVVDDSDINQEVARRILTQQGAEVATCSDGAAAVDYVRSQHAALDLILMDVQMPVLDGNAAARCIRQDLQLPDIPIVALTAGALVAERHRSLEAGMNDVVTKPFDPQVLIRKVRRLVEEAQGKLLPMVIVDRNASAVRPETSIPPGIDAGVVRQMFGDDLPMFRLLLGRMLKEYEDLAGPMAIPPDEPSGRSQLEMRAHRLKGGAGMLGAREVTRLAGAVERALGEQRPTATIEELLQQLASALTSLRADTRAFLEAAEAGGPAPPVLDAQACGSGLDELCNLLATHNLAALDKFSALAPSLAALFGAVRLSPIREAIQTLEFQTALQLLREAQRGLLPERLQA
jgi:PAS domain S-box-containing protein